MNLLDIFSLFILLVILAVAVAVILGLAWLPGSIARKRHSPWTEAVNVSGWSGMLLGIVLGLVSPTLLILLAIWVLALVAAFIKPRTGEGAAIVINESESSELATVIEALLNRVTKLEDVVRGAGPRPLEPITEEVIAMLVATLVICYVLILRHLDQKNRERDRVKAGLMVTGPADYAMLKTRLMEISQRLDSLEKECRVLVARAGGA